MGKNKSLCFMEGFILYVRDIDCDFLIVSNG